MTKNISDISLIESYQGNKDGFKPRGIWHFEITRADGTVEKHSVENLVVSEGLDTVASRLVGDTSSPFGFLAVGTVTAAASLGSTVTGFGEVDRKAASIAASSNEVGVWVATWAGNTDGLTGVDLMSAAVVNHASSGQGTALNIALPVSATLAASDFLKVQVEVQCGSY